MPTSKYERAVSPRHGAQLARGHAVVEMLSFDQTLGVLQNGAKRSGSVTGTVQRSRESSSLGKVPLGGVWPRSP